jgi:nitric oxide reductase NorQ protein
MGQSKDEAGAVGEHSVVAAAPAEPFYLPVRDEIELFRAAYERRIPVLLKGPMGCGKTRFVERMAWELPRGRDTASLVTVTCHDDITAADLVGRHVLSSAGTSWRDGPLTQAVRRGAICYLDEVVLARKDTTVVLHPLTDHRRSLSLERLGVTLRAHPDFLLVVSYDSGDQATTKDLKPSTRQRFMTISFDYPARGLETRIIAHEADVDEDTASALAFLGLQLRRLGDSGVIDGPSTRLLVNAGGLIRRGVPPRRACDVGVTQALTDDADVECAVTRVVAAVFPA